MRPIGGGVASTGESHRVTTLELFFDLVFVFAITQVTAMMAADPSALGALRGLVVLALLWWAWCSYAWLGNQARADEGPLRVSVVVAMGGLFVVALAIPETFSDRAGGLVAPVAFALAYALVRMVHLGVYYVAAAGDAGLRRTLRATAVPVSVAGAVLVAGAVAGPPYQLGLWLGALAIDYVGVYASGTSGWRVQSAAHFAERHGLIVIVALGESIVAVGAGVTGLPLSVPVVVAAALGLLVSLALWWLYFDVVALVAERALAAKQGPERTRQARDSYTYLHFPMVLGIVYLSLGLKKVLGYVGDSEHHDLGDALTGVPLWAMYGGVATYLLAHVAFRWRNIHTLNVHRFVAVAALLALAPVAAALPALAALAILAAVRVLLVAYDVVRFADARYNVRRGEHRSVVSAPVPEQAIRDVAMDGDPDREVESPR